LETFLSDYNVVESTPDVGVAWAQLRVDAQRVGRPIERQDAWVAAVAVALNLPLVTRNASHFAHIPLPKLLTEPDR
jgi:predicted nucleic acid-binding protein